MRIKEGGESGMVEGEFVELRKHTGGSKL